MSHELFVARQPIFDGKTAVTGYELLFRSGPDNVFRADDPDVATMQNLDTALGGFGLDNLVGTHVAFVNVTERVLREGLYTLLPPEQTVLELPETIDAAAVVESCRRARGEGYRIALDHYTGDAARDPLIEVTDVVKIACGGEAKTAPTHLFSRFGARNVWRVAMRLETHEDRARAEKLGYTHFQGHFFCRPQVLKTADLPMSRHNLVQFLREVNRDPVSFDRLEDLLRVEASLSIRLLRYLNSAGFGWRYEVPSVRQAIRLLGVDALRKWASLMAVRGLSEGRPNELLTTALVRANFAERVGTVAGFERADLELFLLGLLSLMDAVLGRPLPEVLSDMALSDASQEALLKRSGPYGSVLSIVEAVESADWDRMARFAEPIQLRTDTLPAHYAAALRWADQTVGSEAFAA